MTTAEKTDFAQAIKRYRSSATDDAIRVGEELGRGVEGGREFPQEAREMFMRASLQMETPRQVEVYLYTQRRSHQDHGVPATERTWEGTIGGRPIAGVLQAACLRAAAAAEGVLDDIRADLSVVVPEGEVLRQQMWLTQRVVSAFCAYYGAE